MKAKTFGAQYGLIEFNHYMDHEKDHPTSVVDIIIECNDISYINDEFTHLFIIITEDCSYVFTNYEVIECYEIGGGLVRVICVKWCFRRI